MGKIFFRIFVAIVIIVCVTACKIKPINKQAEWQSEIIKADKEFSKLSNKVGMKKAFIEYMDDNGVLLRAGYPPIVGANAIEYLTEINDSSYTLTWEPSTAHVSNTGDLGYTYGIYNLQLQDTTLQGTYVSIWRKEKEGKWKFVLDTGNPGIKSKAQ